MMDQVFKQDSNYYAANVWNNSSRFAEMQRLQILRELTEK
jgi:hypothetical protein